MSYDSVRNPQNYPGFVPGDNGPRSVSTRPRWTPPKADPWSGSYGYYDVETCGTCGGNEHTGHSCADCKGEENPREDR
jgi:hypothetical protein